MNGSCGLCRKSAVLIGSHLLPAGLFKAIAQGHAPYDNAPVLVDIARKVAVQSNTQARKPFLCTECEQRFSSQGESHVIALCHRKNGEFRLRDILKSMSPSHFSSGRAVYFGNELPAAIQGSEFQYFVLSVLWRASATDWPLDTGVKRGCLGPYEEEIRKYLLDERAIPQEVSVNVHVNFETEPTIILAYPTTGRTEIQGHRVAMHNLHIPGMRFTVLIGRNVPTLQADELFATAGDPTFFEWRPTGTPFHKKLLRDVAGLTSKGKLAKD